MLVFLVATLALAAPVDDLDALERLVSRVHPAPFRYTPEAELQAAFAEERARLATLDGDPAGTGYQLAAARSVHRVMALLGDAHVQVGLPMAQPTSTTPVSILPLLPRRVQGRVLVDASVPALPVGTELLDLDGRPVDRVYEELAALVSVDGREADAATWALEHDFPRFHAVGYGMPAQVVARVRLPDGDEQDIVLTGLPRGEVAALRAARQVKTWWGEAVEERLPTLAWEGTAPVLRVPTMGVGDMDAFRGRVDELFTQIPPDGPLIIDLRGNQGGLRPNAFAVLDHLLAEPYVGWMSTAVAVRRVPRSLRAELAWPYGSDKDRLGKEYLRDPDGHGFQAEGDPLAGFAAPEQTHRGPVRLLVDGGTGSAANNFVLIMRRYRPDTVLIGQRLGGACDRHVGELPLVWTGPSTGIVVMFSLIDVTHIEVPGCQPGSGLLPDVQVEPTVHDFIAGVDPWMQAAREGL